MRSLRLLLILCALALLPCLALADTTITLTFTGDVTLGGEEYRAGEPDSFASVYEREGPEYFLKNFADFFAEDDLTVINLEGVLTDNDSLPPVQEGKLGSYFFKGKTEYTSVLTSSSVEAVTIANNHTWDYGEQGVRDTIAALEAAGVAWFGTNNRHTTDTERFLFFEKDGVTICLVSVYWEDYLQGQPEGCGAFLAQEIARIKQSGEASAVIAVFHGGQEYGRHRSGPQTVFTKMAMKAGADLVICHHAHVVMGMDVIGNRSAVYSLGNFCFGGNRYAYQTRGDKVQDAAPALVVRAVLTFDDQGVYKGQQLTLYPVQTTSVDRVGRENQPNTYQPKFVTGRLGANVLRLMQVDMNYDLKNAQNKALKQLVTEKEKELAAMDSSEGMSSLTLPFLPAE
ncbi:MAG: CapA family protein [Clostridiales bacterium]|nr:CapA family protein [Clostridiales bacterium]